MKRIEITDYDPRTDMLTVQVFSDNLNTDPIVLGQITVMLFLCLLNKRTHEVIKASCRELIGQTFELEL